MAVGAQDAQESDFHLHRRLMVEMGVLWVVYRGVLDRAAIPSSGDGTGPGDSQLLGKLRKAVS